ASSLAGTGLARSAAGVLSVDGSETIVNAGTDISITGDGTSGTPYVVNSTFTEVDGSITNEIQDLSNVLVEGADAGGTVVTNLGTPVAAGDATTKAYVDSQITANTADGSETIVNAGTDISITGDGTSGTPYVVNSTFMEVDGSITNEIQDAGEVDFTATGNTTSTDVQGAIEELQTELDGVDGTDDQEADEVDLATDVDLNEDGTNETTVQEALSILNAMPKIYATGKVAGNGTTASIYGATVLKLNEGDYRVDFSSGLANANYIIQLSILDCGGDCPGNTTTNYDDAGITYYSQTTTGFSVNIGDSDNGGTPKDDIDLEFMFTVIVIP
uniref:hypothetical protein n=1 Tax=Maribacter antarcticus TaxID=505250 RepID=UPI00056924CC